MLIGFERLAHYSTRALLVLWLVTPAGDGGAGWPETEVPSLLARLLWMGAVATAAGGVAGALAGPYVPMALGALIATLGYVLLGTSSGVWGPLVLVTLGAGLVRPCAWAALGQSLPSPLEHVRGATFLWAYAALNLAALVGSSLGGLVGLSGVFWLSAVALLPVPVLAVALGVVDWRVPRSPVPGPAIGKAAGIAVVVILLAAPFWLLVRVASGAQFVGATQLGLPQGQIGLLMGANPVVVLAGAVFLALALVGAQLAGLRWPPIVLSGVAMVAAGVGVLALHPAAVGLAGLGALGVGVVTLALTEVAVLPLMMARVAGDGHPRVAPILVAAWLVLATPISVVGGLLEGLPLEWVLLGVAALSGLGGTVVVALGLGGRRWLMPALPETDGSA